MDNSGFAFGSDEKDALSNDMASTLNECFSRLVAKYSDEDYVVQGMRRLTYAEVDCQARGFARTLKEHGLSKGSRVGLMTGNVPEYLVALQGCFKMGAIAVPLNERAAKHEISAHLANTACEALVISRKVAEKAHAILSAADDCSVRLVVVAEDGKRTDLDLDDCVIGRLASASLGRGSEPSGESGALAEAEWADCVASGNLVAFDEKVLPDDVALLQYTGGTTGTPKAVVLTHRNLVSTAFMMRAWAEPVIGGRWLRCLLTQPLYHVMGLVNSANLCLARGGTCVLPTSPRPEEILDAIRCWRPTYFAAVPTLLVKLEEHDVHRSLALASLELVVVGGSPVPEHVRERFENAFHMRIMQGYGMSEAPVIAMESCVVSADGRRGLMPLPGVQVRVVQCGNHGCEVPQGEAGELLVKGPTVGVGYWRGPDVRMAFGDGEWLATGDIVRWAPDGSLYIVGRNKDVIVSSGFNVYPREIDEVLFSHPAVREVCTIGVSHPERVEVAKSFVALCPGAACTAAELMDYCRQNLTAYKVPTEIAIIDQLPRTSAGKPDRIALRKQEGKLCR